MTETVNPKLEFAERLFKTLVWDNLISAALVALFAGASWLAWPPMRQIITGVVLKTADWLFKNFKLVVDLEAIAFLNHEHEVAYNSAYVGLREIAERAGENSEEFKRARENAKADLSKFGRYNQ